MTLMANGKKVIGWALGSNEFLSGNGVENLNAFYIDSDYNIDLNHESFTIDMAKYFNEADAEHSDVQYYQIILKLFYKDSSDHVLENNMLTPLLKRGVINDKRSGNEGNLGTISVWFTDNTTLAVRIKTDYDNNPTYSCTIRILDVYGFTSQDVGSVS